MAKLRLVPEEAGAAHHDDAPSDPVEGIDRIRLECHDRACAIYCGSDRGGSAGAKYDLLTFDNVVDRPDRWQRVMGEDHPPHRNAA